MNLYDEIQRTDKICGGMYSCINTEFNADSPLCKECLMDTQWALENLNSQEEELHDYMVKTHDI